MSLISSPQNERVKLVRLLQHQAKARRQHGRLVLEGVRLMRDVLDSGVRPDFVLYVPDAAPDGPAHHLIQRLQDEQLTCHPVTEALMRAMSDTETPQGVLGVFPWPDLPLPDPVGLAVIADGWRDPGNLGTLIRTAAAAGVDLVATTPGTVDPFNPKTIRAGMGRPGTASQSARGPGPTWRRGWTEWRSIWRMRRAILHGSRLDAPLGDRGRRRGTRFRPGRPGCATHPGPHSDGRRGRIAQCRAVAASILIYQGRSGSEQGSDLRRRSTRTLIDPKNLGIIQKPTTGGSQTTLRVY